MKPIHLPGCILEKIWKLTRARIDDVSTTGAFDREILQTFTTSLDGAPISGILPTEKSVTVTLGSVFRKLHGQQIYALEF
jgi:hypothetical protein